MNYRGLGNVFDYIPGFEGVLALASLYSLGGVF